MYVFDATPLIYLAKAGRLSLVGHLERNCVVPDLVHDEVVVTGLQEGYADARRVERAVEDGSLEVRSIGESPTYERLRDNENLSEADATVLALAAAEDATAVIDEEYGRAVADAEGIQTRGTAFLVLRLLGDGAIDPDDARETIDAMVDAGWYCAPDLYAEILRKVEELS